MDRVLGGGEAHTHDTTHRNVGGAVPREDPLETRKTRRRSTTVFGTVKRTWTCPSDTTSRPKAYSSYFGVRYSSRVSTHRVRRVLLHWDERFQKSEGSRVETGHPVLPSIPPSPQAPPLGVQV